MDDLISRQAAIDALWKALYEYEDETEKKFQESEDLDIQDWIQHRIFVQNMSDIDRQTILNLPSAQFEERKESLCKKVRALCEESKIEFFFVGGGESTWSVTNDKHIKKIVECHKAQLSQEGTTKDATSDTISRQAAIDAVYKSSGTGTALKALKALPSAQPEQRWFPCSERLPEVGKDVMVCYDFKGHRSVLIGVLYGDEKFHGYDDEYLTPEGRKYRKAVAWMPLPEPWRGEQDG